MSLPIFAKIDDVMTGLMEELELQIPKWWLRRYIKIALERRRIQNDGDCKWMYSDGTLFEVFKGKMKYNGKRLLWW